MPYDWKKNEKQFYLPKDRPESLKVPPFNFFQLEGQGNPNDDFFAEYIGVLYALSYAVKMSPKHGIAPEGYIDYCIFPLEGVWDINDDAKASYNGVLDKNSLIFKLMIRQPAFVTENFASRIIEITKQKKAHPLLEKVQFISAEEGLCVQMLHNGSYADEPQSFAKMEAFAAENQLKRICQRHREIYLSDARKVAPEKLRTVLRFQAEPI